MKLTSALLIIGALTLALAAPLGAMAQGASDASKTGDAPMPSPGAADMTDGEVRKVDRENKKVTIKHGEIKNLEMPGMTMVFQVKDPAVLDTLKTGDMVRFRAEKAGGGLVVTEIQVTK